MTFPTRKSIDCDFLRFIQDVLRKASKEFDAQGCISLETFDNLEEIEDTISEMLDEQEEE
jgi:hypothetical protein